MAKPIFELQHLSKVYDGIPALSVDALTISHGESFGLVGNNGAGKTTLFSLLLDIIKATGGCVRSKGEDVRLSENWKKYTGSYLDESFIIDFLTPEEYFDFICSLHGMTKEQSRATVAGYEDFFNGEVLGKKKYIRELSKGNQKKVGIIGALLTGPEVLILDEPFPHLDPSSVIRLKKILKEQSQRGVTLCISSHDLNHVTEVCTRIVLLEKGNIISDTITNENTLRDLENYFAIHAD